MACLWFDGSWLAACSSGACAPSAEVAWRCAVGSSLCIRAGSVSEPGHGVERANVLLCWEPRADPVLSRVLRCCVRRRACLVWLCAVTRCGPVWGWLVGQCSGHTYVACGSPGRCSVRLQLCRRMVCVRCSLPGDVCCGLSVGCPWEVQQVFCEFWGVSAGAWPGLVGWLGDRVRRVSPNLSRWCARVPPHRGGPPFAAAGTWALCGALVESVIVEPAGSPYPGPGPARGCSVVCRRCVSEGCITL